MEFRWSPNFSLPDPTINEQHKHLFALCNKFFMVHQYGDDKVQLKLIIKELYEYAQKHFKDEEKYLQSIQYPLLSEHREKHESIIAEMNQILKTSHSFDELGNQLFPFLKKWILEHVRNEDMKIKEFLAENSSNSEPQKMNTE